MATRVLIGLFCLLMVCFYIGYGLADRRSKEAMAVQQQLWEDEIAQRTAGLKTALIRARSESPSGPVSAISERLVAPAPALPSPADALDQLVQIRMPDGNGYGRVTRRVVFLLETLVIHGEQSLPLIRALLNLNHDVEYAPALSPRSPYRNSLRSGRAARGRRLLPSQTDSRGGRLSTEFAVPPSLRLGLFNVVHDIGGAEAEAILVEVLGDAGRGVELASLVDHLDHLAPGKHREKLLAKAHELLSTPLEINNPTLLDDLSLGYLFAVLEHFQDSSFGDEALKRVLTGEQRLNPPAVRYLVGTVGTNALPGLAAIYREGQFSNRWDRVSLGMEVLMFAGVNAVADELFQGIVANNGDPVARSALVQSIAGGDVGPFSLQAPSDRVLIQRRRELVKQAAAQTEQQSMKKALEATLHSLEDLLADRRSGSTPLPKTLSR